MNHKQKGFIFRLSDEDFADLNHKVKMTRMDRQKYMRMIIGGGKPSAAPSEGLLVILHLFNKILNNLWQLEQVYRKRGDLRLTRFKHDYDNLQRLECDFICRRVKWKI